ncbi:MAG TPA: hypothetical protein VMT97_14805 [Terriglobales bacterium]|nr:hypothetical protein [Terriglobales bacterium]
MAATQLSERRQVAISQNDEGAWLVQVRYRGQLFGATAHPNEVQRDTTEALAVALDRALDWLRHHQATAMRGRT